jgi:hypothetical protein
MIVVHVSKHEPARRGDEFTPHPGGITVIPDPHILAAIREIEACIGPMAFLLVEQMGGVDA